MVEGFADVLGDEVAGKVGVESFAYTGYGLGCTDKGLIVTVVGDHDAVGGSGVEAGEVRQVLFESVSPLSRFGRYGEYGGVWR